MIFLSILFQELPGVYARELTGVNIGRTAPDWPRQPISGDKGGKRTKGRNEKTKS